ncbi:MULTISPECIES: DUF485 domain-containing protein [Bradyrhizobium]|uniref:DUF485 domain-containing protein n=1 Tax=Bradyrhizobium elkanii TaxID=29448 RepID=A0A4U6RX47_BRAEL|nr:MULTISPECIES: DUF485 domain-containing protein [Bradyrhizobium]MTV12990.1 DUF485 domain-containing protein [Bradyrhizobium sp. BR2003]TKV78823.1 DUF485 domain-containing protein [Bradyrhizobium elkanii]
MNVVIPGNADRAPSGGAMAKKPAKKPAEKLARKRLTVALVLSVAMIAIYFGFMGLFAFDKPLLGTILMPGLSLCIVLGPLVIISSFVLCLVYVLWANRVFDAGVRELR